MWADEVSSARIVILGGRPESSALAIALVESHYPQRKSGYDRCRGIGKG